MTTIESLHLVEVDAPWSTLAHISIAISRAAPGTHAAVLIGGSNHANRARTARIDPLARIRAPLQRPELAAHALRSALIDLPTPSTIHAWSPRTAALAHLASPRTPRIAILDRPPDPREPHIAQALVRRALRSAAHLAFIHEATRAEWLPALPTNARASIIGAAADPDFADADPRETRRTSWPAIAPGMTALTPAAEPEFAIDARAIAFHAAILLFAQFPAAAVLPPRAGELERALRFTERYTNAWPIVIDDAPPWRTLPACDVAVWTQGHAEAVSSRSTRPRTALPGATPLAWAALFGTPIVAERTPLALEAAGGEDHGWFTHITQPPDLPSRIAAMLENHDERRARTERARAWALRDCNPQHWSARLRECGDRA